MEARWTKGRKKQRITIDMQLPPQEQEHPVLIAGQLQAQQQQQHPPVPGATVSDAQVGVTFL